MNAVDCEGLSVRSETGFALKDVTVQIPQNQFLAIVGPNGSGKSTFLKAILGLAEAATGSIRVMGYPPGSAPGVRVGYVPQTKSIDRHFPSLAIELVVSGLIRKWPARISPEHRRIAMESLAVVKAESLAEQSLAKLSGGELQRVYMARALAVDPQILVLDEPATGIDANGEEAITQALDRIHATQTTTILMVTHDFDVARHHADACMVLNQTLVDYKPSKHPEIEEAIHRAYGHAAHRHQRGE